MLASMRTFWLLALMALWVGVAHSANLQKTCSSNPTMDADNAVGDGNSFTLQCSFSGGEVDFCLWTHFSPEIEQPTQSDTLLTDCRYSAGSSNSGGQNGALCPSRITGQTSTSSCSITVSQSTNDDTGNWHLTAVAVSPLNNQVSPSTNDFEVYTYNETRVDILGTLPNQGNNARSQQSSYQVTYAWNDRNGDWEDDTQRQFEQLEFYCQAPGARPNPTFRWYVGQGRGAEIQGTDDFLKLSDPQNHRGSSIRQYGYRGMIQDYESQLSMKIDTDLLNFLNSRANIDTNPEQGNFQFDLTCEVDQSGGTGGGGGGQSGGNSQQTVTVMVTKAYDNGMMPASTIGIIVGCLVAGVLVVVAIGLLLFARSRNMWCFDDYNDANDPRSRPQQAGVPHQQPNQPAQVHSDPTGDNKRQLVPDPAVIPGDTKKSTIIKVNHEKSSSSHRSRTNSSSSSSNNNNNNNRNNGYKQWPSSPSDQQSNTRDFVRNDAARSTGGGSHGTGAAAPPPRPYKSPDLYANTQTRSFKSDPRNQVLPAMTSSQQSNSTSYATVMSNSRTMQYQEKRVNGEIVSQSVHEQ